MLERDEEFFSCHGDGDNIATSERGRRSGGKSAAGVADGEGRKGETESSHRCFRCRALTHVNGYVSSRRTSGDWKPDAISVSTCDHRDWVIDKPQLPCRRHVGAVRSRHDNPKAKQPCLKNLIVGQGYRTPERRQIPSISPLGENQKGDAQASAGHEEASRDRQTD